MQLSQACWSSFQVRQQLSEMKSHVQDGVVGLRADSGEPAPLEVRVVRPLTLNHIPCPVSPSLTAWRTARGFAVVAAVLSPVLCAGGKPAPPSRQLHVLFPLGTRHQLAFTALFPLETLCHSMRLAGFSGRQAADAASPCADVATS